MGWNSGFFYKQASQLGGLGPFEKRIRSGAEAFREYRLHVWSFGFRGPNVGPFYRKAGNNFTYNRELDSPPICFSLSVFCWFRSKSISLDILWMVEILHHLTSPGMMIPL